jgi:hypothetical protein
MTDCSNHDFFAALLCPSCGPAPTVKVHARAWPGTQRSLCTGVVVDPGELSAETPTDEDADVTCAECLCVIREATKESR